jgi:hypothetical protein
MSQMTPMKTFEMTLVSVIFKQFGSCSEITENVFIGVICDISTYSVTVSFCCST